MAKRQFRLTGAHAHTHTLRAHSDPANAGPATTSPCSAPLPLLSSAMDSASTRTCRDGSPCSRLTVMRLGSHCLVCLNSRIESFAVDEFVRLAAQPVARASARGQWHVDVHCKDRTIQIATETTGEAVKMCTEILRALGNVRAPAFSDAREACAVPKTACDICNPTAVPAQYAAYARGGVFPRRTSSPPRMVQFTWQPVTYEQRSVSDPCSPPPHAEAGRMIEFTWPPVTYEQRVHASKDASPCSPPSASTVWPAEV